VQLLDLRRARGRGAEALVDCQFNKEGNSSPVSAANAAVGSFSQRIAPGGKEMGAVNVRCLDGVDLSALTLTLVDGKKWWCLPN